MAKSKTLNAAQQLKQLYDGVEVVLPMSGITVKLRSVTLTGVVKAGKLPDTLSNVPLMTIADLLNNIGAAEGNQDTQDLLNSVDELYVNWFSEAMVEPRIVDNPDPDKNEIAYKWIGDVDRDFIMGVLQRPVNEWSRFLEEYRASLEFVPDGSAIQPDTE